MKTKIWLFLIAAVSFTPSLYAQAPTWSDAQGEVWAVVQQSWEDDASENARWPGEYTHEKFMTWGDRQPAPRDRDTYTRWERMNEEAEDTFWYEITPLAIIVEGETAVVMYSVLTGEESESGDRRFTALSIVETLTQQGDNWQFLASTSSTPNYGD